MSEGPPWSVTDDDRRQTTTDASERYKSGPYTICRRASNNELYNRINESTNCTNRTRAVRSLPLAH